LGEERAAEWFLGAWSGEHGMWMLGYVFSGCSIHNNALESTWKWLKANTCTKNGGRRSSIQLFTVLMLRHFSDQSKLAEANLCKLGHPNTFPAEPVVSRDIWKAVQTMDPTYIQCCKVLVGNSSRFSEYVTKVVATEGEFLHDRLQKMKKFKEDDLKELLFPTEYTLRKVHDADSKKRPGEIRTLQ
jgi:hypothetical protein